MDLHTTTQKLLKNYLKIFMSFDFKRLYTNIPHDKVIKKVSDLINRCFDEKKVKYINVFANFKASWSDDSKLKCN